jgi:hypothetical protein
MNATQAATQTPVEFVNRNSRKGPTCACGRVQGVCDNSCNTFAARETVTVALDGNVYRWYRNPTGGGLRKHGQEAFRTLAEAVDAAQSIARCYGAQYAGVEGELIAMHEADSYSDEPGYRCSWHTH